MKAAPLMTRSFRTCSLAHTLGPSIGKVWEFDDGYTTVIDAEREAVELITDRALARAAYVQAVALYDSCVQYATVNQLQARVHRSSEASRQKRGGH